jgi:hypothetical protein
MAKAKWLNRQEFVVVGWSDPEGTRPHLGALLLGYYTDDGKLIYVGRVGTGMPDKVLGDLRRRLEPLSRASQDSFRLAARPVPRPLGRAEACRRDYLFDLDSRRVASPHRLRRPPRGQAGETGSAGSMTCSIAPICDTANFPFGRITPLQGPPREGPESALDSSFHCEREISFTAPAALDRGARGASRRRTADVCHGS